MFFATTAGILDLNSRIVADVRKVTAVEESARVRELGKFVTVSETAGCVADVERHVDLFARGERRLELIDGVHVIRAERDDVEWAAELEVGYRGFCVHGAEDAWMGVGDMDLRNGGRGFVLENEVASS